MKPLAPLWSADAPERWREAQGAYEARILRREVNRLPELDRWFRTVLPESLRARASPFVTPEELAEVAQWKMKRGVFRGRNLALIRGNSEAQVLAQSRAAFAAIPDLRKPVTALTELGGVGPATASAVLAAFRPDLFPFFDEEVARQIPGLGEVKFTSGYYFSYGEALRERARRLSAKGDERWTAHALAQALWAVASGEGA